MRFEWDPAKDALNRNKHGIGFEEASGVFATRSRWLVLPDDTHSDEEVRFRAIGLIARGVMVVVHTDDDGEVIRIISARRATVRERRLYEDWTRRLL